MIDQAVLLATDAESPLRRVAGLALVRRAILTLGRGGVKRVVVVGGEAVRAAVAGLGVEVVDVLPSVDAPVLRVRADHVFEPSLVSLVARAPLDGVDVVRVAGMDGLMAVTPRALAGADGLAAREVSPGEIFWQRVDSAESQARAERGLFQLLRKRVDGPVARYVNRPISLSVTRRIIDTSITPNQMSVVAGIIGLVGVWLVLAAASWWTLLGGALLLQLQSILDGCDGELARLKFQNSKLGEWLDNVTDDVLNILYCGALGVAASRFTGASWAVWAGYAGSVGFVIYSVVLYHQLATVHGSGNPFLFRFWFQREGEDLKAALERPGFVTRVSAFFRAIGRRDAFLLLFVGLILVRLPQIAALWYGVVGVMNGGVCVVHTFMRLGGRAAR